MVGAPEASGSGGAWGTQLVVNHPIFSFKLQPSLITTHIEDKTRKSTVNLFENPKIPVPYYGHLVRSR